jgi:hypothetical protein
LHGFRRLAEKPALNHSRHVKQSKLTRQHAHPDCARALRCGREDRFASAERVRLVKGDRASPASVEQASKQQPAASAAAGSEAGTRRARGRATSGKLQKLALPARQSPSLALLDVNTEGARRSRRNAPKKRRVRFAVKTILCMALRGGISVRRGPHHELLRKELARRINRS